MRRPIRELPGFDAWAQLRRPALGAAAVEALGDTQLDLRPEWAAEPLALEELDELHQLFTASREAAAAHRAAQGEEAAANDPEPEASPRELALERLPECPACGRTIFEGGHSCLEEDA